VSRPGAFPDDWRAGAVDALRGALTRWRGGLRPLAEGAVDHLDRVLSAGTGAQIAAIAVPLAVFTGVRGTRPPDWLSATAAATYLAWDVLDDDMDGDPAPFWGERSTAERTIGAHLLIATAVAQAPAQADPALAPTLVEVFAEMVATVAEGQLTAEIPLGPGTTPATVAAGIDARSGAMLAGLADLAAVAAGADPNTRRAARRFGRELALARQLVNDLTELESGRTSDLRNRTATMLAAFALQRTPAAGRVDLVDRLGAAAADGALRQRLISGELRPAVLDTRMLARLHLADAVRSTDLFVHHRSGRPLVGSLIDYTARALGAAAGRP
jgi:hypothetical protein